MPELLDKKLMSLEMEIDEKKSIKEAISRLEVHELGNASQIANSLRPVLKKDDEIKETVPKRWLYIVITILIITIFLLYVYFKGRIFAVKLMCSFYFSDDCQFWVTTDGGMYNLHEMWTCSLCGNLIRKTTFMGSITDILNEENVELKRSK